MNKVHYILFLLFMVFATKAVSQDGDYITVRDFESWSSVGLKYKVKHNWSFGLEEQLRLSNNSSEVDAYLTELNTNFGLTDNVYGAIAFRYIRENDTEGNVQGYENHMRLHFDLGYTYQTNRLEMDYRLRWQTKNELGISSDEGDFPSNHLRFKVGLKYNIKKWKLDPEFSSEIFRHYETGEITDFNKFRITLGTKYKIKGFGKIGAFYRMERELNGTYPKTTNIVGLKYSYTINSDQKGSKKKKKKKDVDEDLIWY